MRRTARNTLCICWVLLLPVLLTGCLTDFTGSDGPAECGDGVREGSELCDATDFGGQSCQTAMNMPYGELVCTEACLLDFSGCHSCGDGVIQPGEGCDDGNGAADDGCSSTCLVEAGWNCTGEPTVCLPVCGDGLVVGTETCDDGNLTEGDGCSATCVMEPGWVCSGEPSVCVESCGDGVVDAGESCDDGNLVDGDGCSPNCGVEAGWQCSGAPSTCSPVCGDGLVVAGREGCDDGNGVDNDGCSATCSVEAGYQCTGEPSVCTVVCGDGLVLTGEACDDGNTTGGDGCAPDCTVEDYAACSGAPSVCVCVVYVDRDIGAGAGNGSSWAAAQAHVRDALPVAASRAPCEIWVAEGTYYTYQATQYDRLELRDYVELYGGFVGTETSRSQRDFVAHPTVLSGQQEGNPANAVRTIMEAMSRQGVVLDGFTVTGAFNTGDDGGGMSVDESDLIVRNCAFDGNQAKRGGAMYVRRGTVEVHDSTFTNNVATERGGAVVARRELTMTIQGGLFSGNTAADEGGAVFSEQAPAMVFISDSRFELNDSNFGGAIIARNGASIAVTNAVFWQNAAASQGGAISLEGTATDPLITNCSFHDNAASPGQGMTFWVQNSSVVLTNSILWGSDANQIELSFGGAVAVSYSHVFGGYSGTAVFDTDPLFVAPASGDLHLQATSACIDAGDGSVAPAADLDGVARVDVAGVPNTGVGNPSYTDIGAYEYQP